jgi:hypothetical protein
MTTTELDQEAFALMTEDYSDTDRRAELAPILLTGYNAAYQDICTGILRVAKWEQVTLDENKQFALSALTETCLEVVKVAKYRDFSADTGWAQGDPLGFVVLDGDEVVVPQAEASGTVWVRYRFVPEMLAAGDSPDFVPDQNQKALVYKGMSVAKLRDGDAESANNWQGMYAEEIAKIRRPDRRTTIANVYGY